MRILFIGGTGNISLSSTRRLVQAGHDVSLLNRSGSNGGVDGAQALRCDISDLAEARATLQGQEWDVVVNWIAFTADDVSRDIELFRGRTSQYVFISSASCYQNPGPTPFITERTPLENPWWEYSRNKIAGELRLRRAFEDDGFPITIVRPSHTYSSVIPITIGGWKEYTTVARMKAGKPIVVQGDGCALWTVTHADDFAKGFCGLLGSPRAIGEDFHITSDQFLSWNEIYQQTAAAVGVEAKIIHVTSDKICQLEPAYTGTLLGDKSVSALFDNSKIKSVVPDFAATIPYSEGIKRVIDWFEEDPARQVVDPATDAFIEKLIATV